jgi:hypothetical protein
MIGLDAAFEPSALYSEEVCPEDFNLHVTLPPWFKPVVQKWLPL